MSTGPLKNNVLETEKNNIINKLSKLFLLKEKANLQNIKNEEYNELIESIRNARRDWLCATSNFNYAFDNETVDYYTYMMKACQIRYEYLIKRAKENGIKGCFIEMSELLCYDNEAMN
ncbi:MAG: YaaL family protein [Bacillota bacterium]|nr:YaaL family protein [Bacillota bacterium]